MIELPSIRASTASATCQRSAERGSSPSCTLKPQSASIRIDNCSASRTPSEPAMILADRPAASTTSTAASQRGANGNSTNTSISESNSSAAAITRAALPARSSRSRSADSADSTRRPASPRRVRPSRPPAPPELITLTASAASAGTWRATSPSCRSGTISRPAVAGSAPCRASCPATASATELALGAAQRRIVDRSVEGAHRNRLVARLWAVCAHNGPQSPDLARFRAISAHNGRNGPNPAGHQSPATMQM